MLTKKRFKRFENVLKVLRFYDTLLNRHEFRDFWLVYNFLCEIRTPRGTYRLVGKLARYSFYTEKPGRCNVGLCMYVYTYLLERRSQTTIVTITAAAVAIRCAVVRREGPFVGNGHRATYDYRDQPRLHFPQSQHR